MQKIGVYELHSRVYGLAVVFCFFGFRSLWMASNSNVELIFIGRF